MAVAPAPAPTPDPPSVLVLRRLVPAHMALLQESWKGTVPPEVWVPFEKADTAFRASDFAGANGALDQLSIRFAEPRWPSLTEPYRRLRVPIPAPVPPHWHPDHGLSAPEKEARQARRLAEDQLALVDASVQWASAHGIPSAGFAQALATAKAALASPGLPPEFYPAVDGIWRELRERLPLPKRTGAAAVPAPAADGG